MSTSTVVILLMCADMGHHCNNKDKSHLQNMIHILRPNCSFGDQCKKNTQEDHLNSWAHPNIRDIRYFCLHGDKCRDQKKFDHLKIYCHRTSFADSGVVRYHYLNENINFVHNQNNNAEGIKKIS